MVCSENRALPMPLNCHHCPMKPGIVGHPSFSDTPEYHIKLVAYILYDFITHYINLHQITIVIFNPQRIFLPPRTN